MPDDSVTYSIPGPDGKKYSLPGPRGMSREQVIEAIKKRLNADPIVSGPPQSQFQTIATDVGRGLVRGGARGLEASTTFVPSLLSKAGEFLETPEETEKRMGVVRGLAKLREGQGSPSSFVERHVGPPQTEFGAAAESIGGAGATAPLQPGGPLTKAVTTVGLGLGGYVGEKAADVLGLDPTLGRVSGGVLGGLATGAGSAVAAEAKARSLLPTSAANRRAAKTAAHLMEAEQLVIDPSEAVNFATGLRADLDRQMYRPKLRGDVGFHAAEQIENSNGDFGTVLAVHSNLGTVKPDEGANYAAALATRDAIREWVDNLQPNQVVHGDAQYVGDLWKLHRDTWRTHSNLQEISDALESAEWRRMSSGRGTNLNTIRQEIRKILDNDNLVRRYSLTAQREMESIVEGDVARNVLRKVAAFAPHGSVSSIPTIAALDLAGHGVGTAMAAGTFLAHYMQGKLEDRSLQKLLDLIREESPLTPGAVKRARARLLVPGRTGVATARSVLSAGAESPLTGPQD